MKIDQWISGSKIRLFRLLGITFQIDATWMIVFGFMTLSLASQFAKDYPHWNSIHYWSAGILTCLMFFISILCHELSHSLVAKVAGLPVRSITLFVLGGISQIGREIQRPGLEFLVAAAGPAASIVLSTAFGLLWVATRARWELVSALAEWLMQINFLLALFNLIPGFPLDGGRILRALLWGASGDFSKATRLASLVGRLAGALFFSCAVALILAGQFVYGLWTLFIGWFLWAASRQNERQIQLRDHLAKMKVADLMVVDCRRVETGMNLVNLNERFLAVPESPCSVVLEHGVFSGLIHRDQLEVISRERWPTTLVEEIMTPLPALRSVHPDQELLQVLETMDREGIYHVPVFDDGHLRGVLGRHDIFHFLKNRFRATA